MTHDMSIQLPNVVITTDGSCYPNDGMGCGGWAVVIRDSLGQLLHELSGPLPWTGLGSVSNNRAELTAILEGLRALKGVPQRVLIRSDSQYAINCVSNWAKGWAAHGWLRTDGTPVRNRDLIELITAEMALHTDVQYTYIRGHNGDPDNERCDQLALAARLSLSATTQGGF